MSNLFALNSLHLVDAGIAVRTSTGLGPGARVGGVVDEVDDA